MHVAARLTLSQEPIAHHRSEVLERDRRGELHHRRVVRARSTQDFLCDVRAALHGDAQRLQPLVEQAVVQRVMTLLSTELADLTLERGVRDHVFVRAYRVDEEFLTIGKYRG